MEPVPLLTPPASVAAGARDGMRRPPHRVPGAATVRLGVVADESDRPRPPAFLETALCQIDPLTANLSHRMPPPFPDGLSTPT